MVRIKYTGKFRENLLEVLNELPDLKIEIDQRIFWFQNNPSDTRLDNHPLRKSMKGKWAFSITDDIRIVYKWIGKKTVRFLAIGGHRRVY